MNLFDVLECIYINEFLLTFDDEINKDNNVTAAKINIIMANISSLSF